MKKALIACSVASLAFTSCSHKEESESHAPAGMVSYDLRKFGKPFAIFVPDTTASPVRIEEDPSGALRIESRSFGVTIREQAEDLQLRKRDVQSDDVNKLQQFLIDDSVMLSWESRIVNPEYHFLINRRMNGSTYSFEDLREPEGAPYSKDAVMKMIDACRNIQWRKGSKE
jgi:hypothetical protein